MKSADDVKTCFEKATIKTNPAGDRVVLADAFDAAGLAVNKRSAWGGAGIGRSIMRSPIVKLTIAAAVIVAVVAGLHTISGSTPAFADIVEPFLTASTATYKVTTSMYNGPSGAVETQFMAPAKLRKTMSFGQVGPNSPVQIIDYEQGKGLSLMPADKTAVVTKLENLSESLRPGTINPLDVFRNIIRKAQENPDETIEYLGESKIGRRRVIGYRVTVQETTVMSRPGDQVTIWIDVRNLSLVQIEGSLEKDMGQPCTITMTDIQLDVPLDPNLFSLEVPEGYKQHQTQVNASTPTEADMVEMFRIWAEGADGKFPPALNAVAVQDVLSTLRHKGEIQIGSASPEDPGMQKYLEVSGKLFRGVYFVLGLPPEADWHYSGAEAAFGDPTLPIFWYRPKGSETYRVVYADLSVLDVAFDNLPK